MCKFPRLYCGFACLAGADLLFTAKLLAMGGGEANLVADLVHQRFGLTGMGVLKLASVAAVVAICEVVARARPVVALRLVVAAVSVTAVPVAMGGGMLASTFAYLGGSFDGSGLVDTARAQQRPKPLREDEVPLRKPAAPERTLIKMAEDEADSRHLAAI